MATLNVTIDPNGTGDYSNINVADAAFFGSASADLVTNTDTVNCTLICTGGTADTTPFSLDYTTDTTYKITLDVGSSYRHDGTLPTSGNIYRLEHTAAVGYLCVFNAAYTEVNGLSLSYTCADGNVRGIHVSATGVKFNDCIVHVDQDGQGNTYALSCMAPEGETITVDFLNCLAYLTGTRTSQVKFNLPQSVATDGTYVYVADTYNHRIVKRLASGLTYVCEVGSLGSGDDQFYYPRGIAALGDYVYVADTSNHRIVKRLAADLSYVAKIGSFGSGDDQFYNPRGIAALGDYVYVADTYNHRIVKRLAADLSYVAKIGSLGSGDDQFYYPSGIAALGDYVYVADANNHRIVKRLAADLSYVAKIGSSGSGDDQFNNPYGIVALGDYVYVADTSNHRIVKRLAADLSYVAKIGSSGSGDDQFYNPYGIAALGDYVYVADTYNHRIVKRLAADLSYVAKIGSYGSGDDQFNDPYGIAALGDYVYVADTNNHRIVKRLAANLSYVAKIGTYGSGDDQFNTPRGIAALGDYVYVADTYNHRIVKRLAADLSYVAKIGTYGSGDDQFNNPRGIAALGDYMYVADTYNHRIVKRLAADLSYVAKIGTYGSGDDQFNYPYDIAALGDYVYVVDTYNHRIVKRLAADLSYVAKIGTYGSGDDQFNNPRGIAALGDYVYVADSSNHRIVKRLAADLSYVAKIGSSGSGDDQFSYPRDIAALGDYVYVADSSNHRIVKRLVSNLAYVSQVGYYFTAAGLYAIQNGTLTVNATNLTLVGFDCGVDVASGTVVVTNVLPFSNAVDYRGSYDAASTNNAYEENSSDPGSNGLDLSTYSGTDLFEDFAGNDYHLKPTSPLRHAGIGPSANASVPTTDIDGEPRSGATCDIGADEYTSTTTTTTSTSSTTSSTTSTSSTSSTTSSTSSTTSSTTSTSSTSSTSSTTTAPPETLTLVVDTTGGGDYVSMKDCAEDLVGTDLQALHRRIHVKCRGGADTGGSAHFRDLNPDFDRYLILETEAGYRTPWIFPFTSGYRLTVTTDAALIISAAYTKLRNMAVNQVATHGWPSGIYFNADNIEVENVLVVSSGVATETYAIACNAANVNTLKLRNVHGVSLATGGQYGFRFLSAGASDSVVMNNCSWVSHNAYGMQFSGSGYSLVAKNCIFHGSPDFADFQATLSAGSTHNAFCHGTTPASGADWVDYTAYGQLVNDPSPGANLDKLYTDPDGNFHLNPTAGPGADGTDLSADAFPVTTHIDGTARSVYYLGAFPQCSISDVPRTTSIGSAGFAKRRRRRIRRWLSIKRRKNHGLDY